MTDEKPRAEDSGPAPEKEVPKPKTRRRRFPNVQEAEKRFAAEFRREELEKGDLPAMIIAALLVFLPALLVVAALVLGVPYLLFRLAG